MAQIIHHVTHHASRDRATGQWTYISTRTRDGATKAFGPGSLATVDDAASAWGRS